MTSLISKKARAFAFVAAVGITIVVFYVHGADRESLGVPSHASLDLAVPVSTSYRA